MNDIVLNDEQASYGIHDELLKIISSEKTGRLLDVGCGAGSLAYKLKCKLKMEVHVTELKASFVRYPEINVIEKNLNELSPLPYPNDYFDYIVMVEVIEHINNPFFVIQELSRVLRPGGKIYITTPNIHHVSSKIKFLFKNEFFGFNEEKQSSPLSHLISFSRRQLKLFLNENGITPINVKYSSSIWGRRTYFNEVIQSKNKLRKTAKYIVRNSQLLGCSLMSLLLTGSLKPNNIYFGTSIIVIGQKNDI